MIISFVSSIACSNLAFFISFSSFNLICCWLSLYSTVLILSSISLEFLSIPSLFSSCSLSWASASSLFSKKFITLKDSNSASYFKSTMLMLFCSLSSSSLRLIWVFSSSTLIFSFITLSFFSIPSLFFSSSLIYSSASNLVIILLTVIKASISHSRLRSFFSTSVSSL